MVHHDIQKNWGLPDVPAIFTFQEPRPEPEGHPGWAGFFVGRDLMVVESEGDRHNGACLLRRVPGEVEFLFPGNS